MYLEKDSNNTVILELTLNSSLVTPYYLFSFSSDTNYDQILNFTGPDTSTYKCRYNKFDIIETGSTYTNLTASTVNLRTGSYSYQVYESSTPTLSLSATTGRVIYSGKVFVNGVDNDIPSWQR